MRLSKAKRQLELARKAREPRFPMAFAAAVLALALTMSMGCGRKNDANSGGGAPAANAGVTLPPLSGDNVMALTVNGSTCSNPGAYPNKPCVSVTVCAPGSSDCQTINDILFDTGSVGFRVHRSVLSASIAAALTPVTTGSNHALVATCAQFGDGSSDWGSVVQADLKLGNEPVVRANIQLIDSTFGPPPSACSSAEASPATAGQNGILGAGIFARDCGNTCATQPGNNSYFACPAGGSCASAAVALTNQLPNPIGLLPVDGNGMLIELPAVPVGGVQFASGYVVFGVGTRANNTPSSVTTYPVDPNSGEYRVRFNGTTYSSFIDTGSNALFFEAPSPNLLPDCGAFSTGAKGFFCPTSLVSLSATTIGSTGSPSSEIGFQVGNLLGFNSANNVFVELGGSGTLGTSQVFDWGLPFFLGRSVTIGLEGAATPLGAGPYWAY